jgi:hypothetical protein
MRGGNRSNVMAHIGKVARVPKPPRNLDREQRRVWVELAREVRIVGTYQASDLTAFRALVRAVTRAELCPLDAPPSAAGRLEQAAASALASFGLHPLARERVRTRPPESDDPEAARLQGLL